MLASLHSIFIQTVIYIIKKYYIIYIVKMRKYKNYKDISFKYSININIFIIFFIFIANLLFLVFIFNLA